MLALPLPDFSFSDYYPAVESVDVIDITEVDALTMEEIVKLINSSAEWRRYSIKGRNGRWRGPNS